MKVDVQLLSFCRAMKVEPVRMELHSEADHSLTLMATTNFQTTTKSTPNFEHRQQYNSLLLQGHSCSSMMQRRRDVRKATECSEYKAGMDVDFLREIQANVAVAATFPGLFDVAAFINCE